MAPDEFCPVEWADSYVVVRLPEEIDISNADQIREQLLALINRGAAVLVADLSATVTCDYAGTYALVRAHNRAVANCTQLRLVGSDIVRRMLAVSGLDRLVPFYPSLEGATADRGAREQAQHAPAVGVRVPAAKLLARVPVAAAVDGADSAEELLDSVVTSIFEVGLILQGATALSLAVITEPVSEAIRRLDDVVRMIRDHLFTEHEQLPGQGPLQGSLESTEERLARAAGRTASLREHVVQTAYVVQVTAADTASLLELRAEYVQPPAQIDYATEIKRWRFIAGRAQEIAHRWEEGTGTVSEPGGC